MAVLVDVIRRYDIILIQEIRDSKETAIFKLLDQVNAKRGDQYEIVVSGRLGRTNSKEQYAYIYKSNVGIEVVQEYQYPDPDEKFQREPFVVKFSVSELGINDLAIAGIHTDPDEAFEEVNELDKVNDAMETTVGSSNIMLMGDFNADCSYVSNSKKEQLVLRTKAKYHWLIGDDADTTTSATDCAYDRFVINGETLNGMVMPGSAKVFRFDTEYGLDNDLTKQVSDHYPIEVQFAAPSSKRSTETSSLTNLIRALRDWLGYE